MNAPELQSGKRPDPKLLEAMWNILGSKLVVKPLYVAACLGIADHLMQGPLPVEELARRSNAHAPSLYRILRALASVGLFEETADGAFRNTPMSELVVDSPQSLRAMLLWINDPRHDHAWEALLHCVRTGETACRAQSGKAVWEWLQDQPDLHAIFNRAMTANAGTMHRAAVAAYDFSGIRTLVDVGGGHGSLLCGILEAYPDIQGVVCDLPGVVAGAQDNIETRRLGNRARAVGGDFFAEVPPGDAHIMSFIIHDWLDEPAAAILRTIHRAQPANGKVLLVEVVVPEGNAPSLGKLIDIEMLVLANGRERRAEEYAALFQNAGYRLNRIVPTESPCFVIEAIRV